MSDPLVNYLPDIPSESPDISRDALEHLRLIACPRIKKANALLPSDAQISFDEERLKIAPEAEEKTYTFTADQLSVLVQSLSAGLQPNTGVVDLQEFPSPTRKAKILIRDVALKYETGAPVTQKEALGLLELVDDAGIAGPLVKRKMKEIAQLLETGLPQKPL